jgi:hypothetical protein
LHDENAHIISLIRCFDKKRIKMEQNMKNTETKAKQDGPERGRGLRREKEAR